VNLALVVLLVASCLACKTHEAGAPQANVGAPQTNVGAPQANVGAPPTATVSLTPPPSKTAFYAMFVHRPPVAVTVELGRKVFLDPGLSASGKLACASCHDPRHAMAPANDRAIQLGGADGKQLGFRAAPGLRYLATLPRFSEHSFESEDGSDGGPTGGFMWDGRAETAHDQARFPLFASFEMANESPAAFAAKLRRAPYANALRDAFGDAAIDDDEAAVKVVEFVLEVFGEHPPEMSPFDSKFDAVLRGKAQLTARELRGFQLFNAPGKGNCASCHPSSTEHGFPLFTDFGFAALGLPRARAIPANADPGFHDLGLCGPLRRDLADRPEYCGMFRTPSLRNVALRRRLFHNGSFTSLSEAVRFYATRDVTPERWYPRDAAGRARKFDDLPDKYHKNVNTDPPFGGHPGDRPALDEAEIADIVAFLGTLTDGYRP
jgi:cytochrome c peroxidase